MRFTKRPNRSRLPASSRASSRVVCTVMSCAASAMHSSIVRTLWPTSRPMSHSVPISSSILRASDPSAADGQQDQQIDVGAGKQLAATVAAHRGQRHVAGHGMARPDILEQAIDQQ